MGIRLLLLQMIIGIFLIPGISGAQEEESAAVSLEEYTDEFQEHFFEALKQKGIENYDKAVQLLLECKRLDASNSVIDHELAKAYGEDKEYPLAQDYAVKAVGAAPGNYWYLETLVDILKRQGTDVAAIREQLPYDNQDLKENLARVYYIRKEYQYALAVLKELKVTPFSKALALKIADSLQLQEPSLTREASPKESTEPIANPMDDYMARIATLISREDFAALEGVAAEAVENFPSMPYFYYTYGMALNKNAKPGEAVGILESGLDYLVEDKELAIRFYTELVTSYTAMGNTSKANMYLSKIKSGS